MGFEKHGESLTPAIGRTHDEGQISDTLVVDGRKETDKIVIAIGFGKYF